MMIELNQVIPIPLKDKNNIYQSEIWGRSIQFNAGEKILVVAPSGSGKTTLVHILYNLRKDYEGKISLDQQDISKLNGNLLADIRQNVISIVFQDLRLFPNLTGRENIEINRVLQKPYYAKNRVEEFAQNLGVNHVLDQPAALCSYGEQQRIAIIRALVQPFSWLILDEPYSHLDKANTRKAARLIEEECHKREAGYILTNLDENEDLSFSRKFKL